MNDLISRTALINYIKAWDIGNGIMHNQDTFIDAVNSQEVVDAKPVVHGEWIEKNYTWACNQCGCHPYKGFVPAIPNFKFCPNCGARMDGE